MPTPCIIHGCKRKRHARGLCRCCYVAAWRLVQTRQATWASLEERGFALAADKSLQERGLFLKALERADANQIRVYRPAQ